MSAGALHVQRATHLTSYWFVARENPPAEVSSYRQISVNEPLRRLHPSKLFESESVVPDLRHMADAVPVELHDVDVV